MRILALLALALTTSPLASAHLADVAVGPSGPSVDQNPSTYFVDVAADVPETPHSSTAAADDCAGSGHPAGPSGVVEGIADRESSTLGGAVAALANPDGPNVYVRGALPRCVATWDVCPPTLGILSCTYASYDVTSGRYYVTTDTHPDLPIHVWTSTSSGTASSDTAITGTTGLIVENDCLDCPPPVCC
ncbi:MAG: hypothetical protein QOE90_2871 [Thermoplasmata archaeon]|nr:hypothetical protein [Thermoplasmata archaeon]